MRAWLTTATAGQKGQARGPASAREADVRQEAKDTASCFFNDLCHLNGDRPRGAPSKEYKETERGTYRGKTKGEHIGWRNHKESQEIKERVGSTVSGAHRMQERRRNMQERLCRSAARNRTR